MTKQNPEKYIPLDISLQFEDLDQLEKLETASEFKDILFESVAEALKFVAKSKDPKIELFKISNLDIIISLSKENYVKTLNNVIEYYTAKEEYIKCGELNKLKKKL